MADGTKGDWRRVDMETGRQGDRETGRQGDRGRETVRQGDREITDIGERETGRETGDRDMGDR